MWEIEARLMVLVLVFWESLGLFVFLSLGVFYNFSLIAERGEWGDKPLLIASGRTGSRFGSHLGFRWAEPLWFGTFCHVAMRTVRLGSTGIDDVEILDGSDWGFLCLFSRRV